MKVAARRVRRSSFFEVRAIQSDVPGVAYQAREAVRTRMRRRGNVNAVVACAMAEAAEGAVAGTERCRVVELR